MKGLHLHSDVGRAWPCIDLSWYCKDERCARVSGSGVHGSHWQTSPLHAIVLVLQLLSLAMHVLPAPHAEAKALALRSLGAEVSW